MRSAVFLASASMFSSVGVGMAHYIASGGGWQGGGALLPPAGREALLQRRKRLRRRRHQPAKAFRDQVLDIVGVDMRVAAGDARILADRQDIVDRGGNLGVLV